MVKQNMQKMMSIIVGSIFIAIGVNNFLLPQHLIDGGILGVAMIVHYAWGWGIGLAMLVFSIPIYIWAWFYSKAFFFNSFLGLIVSALLIDLVHIPYEASFSPLIESIIGGVLLGIGTGVMFLYDVSTGGLDLFAQTIADMTRSNVGIMIFILDVLVIFGGLSVLTMAEILLSIISVCAVGLATTLTIMLKPQVNRDYSHAQS